MIVSKLVCLSSLFAVVALGFDAPVSQRLPFSFVENKGQAASIVKFTGQGPGFKAWFEKKSIIFQQGTASTRMTFAGSSDNAQIIPGDPIGANASYFRGNDPDLWITDLPMFASLRYQNVWNGVDVSFRRDGSQAKTDYIVASGASVEGIRLKFDGNAAIQPDGSLLVSGGGGDYREEPPIIYQGEESDRQRVDGGFYRYSDGSIGFRVGRYDHQRSLVIDPAIVFSGYFGGSSETTITALAVNSSYNVVVAGWTMSTNLPASGGADTKYGGGVDAFVAEFSPAGGKLIFCTYLGGSGDDRAFALAVDASNNTYITGWTSSSNFPVASPLQSRLGGTRDAFVAKLNASGNAMIFSTYLGGSGVDAGYGIAIDTTGAPVVAGDTTSTNLAVTSGAFQTQLAGAQNAFVARLSQGGNALTSITYLGGNATDHAAALKLDSSNAIFVAGSTYSTNLPVLNAFQPNSGGGQDGFITKLTSNASSLVFSSYYGGAGGSPGSPEGVNTISVPVHTGNVNLGGITSSINFPVTQGSLQPIFGGGQTDGFLGRVNGTTGALLLSTYLGGSGDDSVDAIDMDVFHIVYAAGYTSSTDFPTLNAIQSSNAGGMDGFAIKTTLLSTTWATYLGGAGNDAVNAIAVDSLTNLVVAGTTGSSTFPVKGSVGVWQGSQLSSFIGKIAPPFTAAVASAPTYIEDVWHNTGYNGPNFTVNQSTFGLAGDTPVAGDWDESGIKRIGSFRNGTWYLDINGNGVFDTGDKTVAFGQAGDVPIVGDWNGTGKIKLGVFRQGSFILDLSGHLSGVATGLSDATFPFGLPGDIPVAADWNQSGTTKVGVFRNGLWLVDSNGDHLFTSADATYTYGQAGDIPVVGDWSGSGVVHLGVYRQGIWILDYSGYYYLRTPLSYEFVFAFGGSSYVPLIM